jgi:hypothetical protein
VNETLASLLSARAAERPAHRGLLAAGLKPGGHVGILMTNDVAYLELFSRSTWLAE